MQCFASVFRGYYTQLKELNAWIRQISLYKRLPLLALSTLIWIVVVYDYASVLQYQFGGLVICLAIACLVLTPFWIGYDAVHWFFPYGFTRGHDYRTMSV